MCVKSVSSSFLIHVFKALFQLPPPKVLPPGWEMPRDCPTVSSSWSSVFFQQNLIISDLSIYFMFVPSNLIFHLTMYGLNKIILLDRYEKANSTSLKSCKGECVALDQVCFCFCFLSFALVFGSLSILVCLLFVCLFVKQQLAQVLQRRVRCP